MAGWGGGALCGVSDEHLLCARLMLVLDLGCQGHHPPPGLFPSTCGSLLSRLEFLEYLSPHPSR